MFGDRLARGYPIIQPVRIVNSPFIWTRCGSRGGPPPYFFFWDPLPLTCRSRSATADTPPILCWFLPFFSHFTITILSIRRTADTFETINRHLRGRLRVVSHFSLGIVERVKCECAWVSTDKAQAFDSSRPTDFGVWSSYPLPNQWSTSNGIPSLTELSLLLSSVNCGGYLLQAKENPDTNFLCGCFTWITW